METSKKLPRRQLVAPQNLRMGHCGLHQSTRRAKAPTGGGLCLCCGAPLPWWHHFWGFGASGQAAGLWGRPRGPQACNPGPPTARGAGPTAKAHLRSGPRGPQVVWGAAWVLVLLGWQCTFCQFGPATRLVLGSFQESSGHPKHVLGGGLPAPKAPAPLGPSPMAHKWCGARCGACRWPAVVRLI